MAERERPVWVWLPGSVMPVQCGTFSWEPGLGRFLYSDEYRNRADAIAIDPMNLPFSRSTRPATTIQMNGVFGVLRDAAPEGFGLDLLNAKHGNQTLDEIERMDFAAGDGVGAIEVCGADEIERKISFVPPCEQEFRVRLANTDVGESITGLVRQLTGDEDGTSLGGEKPKLTISREVDGKREWWIAKLQPRNGARLLPAREYVAMKLARQCNIDVAEVQFERIGVHEVVLVKRFDRNVVDDGVERSLFASAATVLRLSSDVTREDPDRSYPKLAHELRRWCGDRHQGAEDQQRELWRRMAYNALVGNYDDHPRNHGLIFRDTSWALSPAYDIVAIPQTQLVQAMAVNRRTRVALPENLVADAPVFAYEHVEAWETLQEMAAIVSASWRGMYVDECGVSEADLELLRPAFKLAEGIVSGQMTLDPAIFTQRRRRTAARPAGPALEP
ncbi:type II toxin-antitoxin system HipA family toxin [Burkholderia sp. Tr-20390]|uniref:type II toxin-antitoxin system HipA family toxin n=1 Tax=Burkholderia sp. Tr-20390 TaxID=2703904 RepID=UPI00197E9148|nr:type II toxin-antitoxin system HipA family toxin [Burkholderia sp. Tr-20390]MBN3729524.1 type II toxin-antitoxin system HipA family toxin [Burkholderia sp. Tr-20390]